ncbi:hypothetical protein GTA08_BOTSDO00360 [Botryosphaeria dothidea]|uniref:Uncharacterized protein n=1 Tax=Botryosphaeria dothidea TaxID=55169 RepID=A0A8H4N6F4_9PEZI|nr:hypothetical protein GTA08_BOTSDO00360 [Botryosphaeria dothidea]
MPCDVEDHGGHHNWPEQGDLRIWPCERACDYCTYQARDSSALRAHVRDVHQPGDFPLINILPGLNRPPVFNPMLHGTPPRPSRQAQQHPYFNQQEIDEVVDQVEDADEFAEQQQQQEQQQESDQPDGDPNDDEYQDGPSSSAARGRRIQFTPKAAAAAEEAAMSNARKRKRGNQRIPGEIFPARMPKPAGGQYRSPYGPPRMADSVRVRGLRPRNLDRSPEDEEDLVSWFKSNINGMFYLGHAAGLSRREIVQSCQEIVNSWTFLDEDE